MKILLLILFLLLLSSVAAFAQGFPWNDFKPRTLKEIVAIDQREINESANRNQMIAHADMLLSVVRVKYIGKS